MISTNPATNFSGETLSILHLEDSSLDHQLVNHALSKAGLPVELVRVDTLDEFERALIQKPPGLVIADYRLGSFTAIDAWQLATHLPSSPPFIILSGTIGEAAAVEAIQMGISDYLHKDEIATLPRVIQRTLHLHAVKLAKEKADQELAHSEQRISELAGHLQTAIERERAAIAREIHDDIGGALAAIRLDLAWLKRHTADPAQLAHIASANDMTGHAAQASQRIMRNLRPAILDQGLVPSIRWLAQDFERRTAARTQVSASSEEIHLSPETMLSAYRTTQEALTNASKYAAGSDIRIDISNLGNTLTVEIEDKGPGLEASALKKPHSYGLRGLSERAKSVGGWLDISSNAQKGTVITLTVPLAPDESST